MKKVLITGLGSIGQRYVRLLRSIYGDEIEIHVFRSSDKNFLINKDFTVDYNQKPSEAYNLIEHRDLNIPLGLDLDVAFITNRPHEHLTTAIKCIESQVNTFIEKPISNSCKGLDELLDLTNQIQVKCAVGHQLRFHPITNFIKDNLLKLGEIIQSEFVFSEYLPFFHKYADYTKSHEAHNDMGGGSILSLNHDIDINMYLLGYPKKFFCLQNNSNALKINSEESAEILLKYDNSISRIFLDFTNINTRRYWNIIGSKGSIEGSLTKNQVKLNLLDEPDIIKDFSDFDRDDMFKDQIKSFIAFVEGRPKCERLCDLKESAEIHSLTMQLKLSKPNLEQFKYEN